MPRPLSRCCANDCTKQGDRKRVHCSGLPNGGTVSAVQRPETSLAHLTVNAGKLKLTHAIQSLDLPSRLSFRLARALDLGLRRRSAGDKTLRRTIADVAVVLYARSDDAAVVVEQLRDTVIAHLEERGVRQSSVLAVVPLPAVFAVEIGELAGQALGLLASDASAAPRARVARWIERARELRNDPDGSTT